MHFNNMLENAVITSKSVCTLHKYNYKPPLQSTYKVHFAIKLRTGVVKTMVFYVNLVSTILRKLRIIYMN
jgi:hypothetical protein